MSLEFKIVIYVKENFCEKMFGKNLDCEEAERKDDRFWMNLLICEN